MTIKVTRLKAGYRITCNDGEYEALRLATEIGVPHAVLPARHEHLPSSAKAAIRRPPFAGLGWKPGKPTEPVAGGPLAVTDDRRGDGA